MSHKFTGKYRHRVHQKWTGKQFLVLQLQHEGIVTTGVGGTIDSEFMTWWEDAKPEQVMQLGCPVHFPENTYEQT